MSSVRLLQNVIETRLERRGKGTESDPIRLITQYWDEHGNFLAESDHFPPRDMPTGARNDE